MTTAQEILDQAAEDLFDATAVDAVFNPAAGDPVDCKIDYREETRQQPDGYEAAVYARYKVVEYLYSEIGREVERGEYFEKADGTVYTVESIAENDGRFVSAIVVES